MVQRERLIGEAVAAPPVPVAERLLSILMLTAEERASAIAAAFSDTGPVIRRAAHRSRGGPLARLGLRSGGQRPRRAHVSTLGCAFARREPGQLVSRRVRSDHMERDYQVEGDAGPLGPGLRFASELSETYPPTVTSSPTAMTLVASFPVPSEVTTGPQSGDAATPRGGSRRVGARRYDASSSVRVGPASMRVSPGGRSARRRSATD